MAELKVNRNVNGPWLLEDKVFLFGPHAKVRCPYCGGSRLDIEYNESTPTKDVMTITCLNCRVDFYADKVKAPAKKKSTAKKKTTVKPMTFGLVTDETKTRRH